MIRILVAFLLLAGQVYPYRMSAPLLLAEGSGCNNTLNYHKALEYLNASLQLSPCVEAYQERALTYFELGFLDAALSDYQKILHLQPPQPIFYSLEEHKARFEFASGLLNGIFVGLGQETVQFVSAIRGGFSFLWSFACHPGQVSREIVNAVYAMGHFLATAQIQHLLSALVPEIVECCQHWHDWSNVIRGQKMGYIIGKYSISVFIQATMIKGVEIFNKLKRANITAILQKCSYNRASIVQQSSRIAAKSEALLATTLKGAVIPKVPNIAGHVMAKHHRWDKLIRLTGDPKKDVKEVMRLLEKHKILSGKRRPKFRSADGVVKTDIFSQKIGSEVVEAVFEVTENGFLLENAWVVTPQHLRQI